MTSGRAFAAVMAGIMLLMPGAGWARIPKHTIKIGVLQDLPQPFAGETGNGAIVAAQMAASDFETRYLKAGAEILPGVASGSPDAVLDQVREWLDKENVAAVLSSAGALTDRRIARMVEQRHRTLLVAATDASLGKGFCSPGVVVWGAGSAARPRALVQALLPREGKRWFVLGGDSPAGIADQSALRDAVTSAGGQIVGEIDDLRGNGGLGKVEPKIAAAKPQVVVFTQGDGDLIDLLRANRTMSPPYHATFAALGARIADIDAAGPAAAEGTVVVAPFYWDSNDATRRFSRRWDQRMLGSHVSDNAAEVYAATASFLHAAKAVDDVDSRKVVAELRRGAIKDTLFGTVTVRQDGRVVHDLSVYRVKPAGEFRQRWAYYTRVATIHGSAAFPPQACRKP